MSPSEMMMEPSGLQAVGERRCAVHASQWCSRIFCGGQQDNMPVTMWLLLVHGKQECLGVVLVCDMGLPRFQHKYRFEKRTSITSRRKDKIYIRDYYSHNA